MSSDKKNTELLRKVFFSERKIIGVADKHLAYAKFGLPLMTYKGTQNSAILYTSSGAICINIKLFDRLTEGLEPCMKNNAGHDVYNIDQAIVNMNVDLTEYIDFSEDY